jgi:peptidoglycan hydrolase-like protein with peptidoglycan-binding domain
VTIVPDEAPLEPAVVDETLAEARASEAALDRGEREMLQIALKWAGFYNSSIDGAFGRGTRASMSAWQDANGYTNTGVLTTLQRADLLAQYNAVL